MPKCMIMAFDRNLEIMSTNEYGNSLENEALDIIMLSIDLDKEVVSFSIMKLVLKISNISYQETLKIGYQR